MNDRDLVVHFGAGALGRGLVIPILAESGKKVIVADTDAAVIERLKQEQGYAFVESDAAGGKKTIAIREAVNTRTEPEKLIRFLRETDTVTTSVRRENLQYIAPLIRQAWKSEDCTNKKVICCENVEDVGAYFKGLLLDSAEEEKHNLARISVPDTVVDRICAAGADLSVTSETFYELSVDRDVLKDTGIRLIDSVDNIKGSFFRKRYLLNSYADGIAFLGRKAGLTYLYEAAASEELNRVIGPLIEEYSRLLWEMYIIPMAECRQWQAGYRKRLSNPAIPRELSTVARNLWQKMSLEERFILPLVQLKQRGHDTRASMAIIQKLIMAGNEMSEERLSRDGILDRLAVLWNQSETGRALLFELEELWTGEEKGNG